MARAVQFRFPVKSNLLFRIVRYVKTEDAGKPILKNPSPTPKHIQRGCKVAGCFQFTLTEFTGDSGCCAESCVSLECPRCPELPRNAHYSPLHTRNSTPQCYSPRTKTVEKNIAIENIKAEKHEEGKSVKSRR